MLFDFFKENMKQYSAFFDSKMAHCAGYMLYLRHIIHNSHVSTRDALVSCASVYCKLSERALDRATYWLTHAVALATRLALF